MYNVKHIFPVKGCFLCESHGHKNEKRTNGGETCSDLVHDDIRHYRNFSQIYSFAVRISCNDKRFYRRILPHIIDDILEKAHQELLFALTGEFHNKL